MKKLICAVAVLLVSTALVGTSVAQQAQHARRFVGAAGSPNPIPPPSSITQVTPPAPGGGGAAGDFTENARVNSNFLTFSQPQVEPSIANNPNNPSRLVAGFADFQNGPVFDSAPGVAVSSDGGRTWSAPAGGAVLPNPTGFIWGDRTLATHLAGGDPAVAWGLGNTVYYSMIGIHDNENPPDNDCAAGGLYVYRSDDEGETWTLPANGSAIANTETVFRDKEYIGADDNPGSPFAGNVYMAWSDDVYSDCPQVFGQNFVTRHISFSFSSDDAATWSPQMILASGCVQAAVPTVGADGDVYVVWFDCNAGDRELVRKSTDGGVTFGPARVAAPPFVRPPNPLIGSSFRVSAPFPSIATDPTDPDKVFVTWSANNGASQTDVFVSRSLDGGDTWSPPLRVNDDPLGNPRDQFFPWMSVDTDGTVRIMWGDDRLDLVNPGGTLYDIFMADSTNSGASFGANVRITTTSSDPAFDGFGGTFIGDYFGLSVSGVAAWDDERNLQQDIYGGRMPCPWDCTNTGDGFVGISDFLLLLAQWGVPGSCDIDGGGVGITDFLALLAHWGPCP
jgi:hypothetical protein